MSPIPRSAVQFTQRIKNSDLLKRTLTLIEEATKKTESSHFTQAVLANPAHTSPMDPREHVTARLATADQTSKGLAQTIHIYFDKNGQFDGYILFPERPEKKGSGEMNKYRVWAYISLKYALAKGKLLPTNF